MKAFWMVLFRNLKMVPVRRPSLRAKEECWEDDCSIDKISIIEYLHCTKIRLYHSPLTYAAGDIGRLYTNL